MREYDVHTLDVFTDRIFGGNPLAVFPDARGIDGATMQRIARELNLSETVFVLPPEAGGTARVRIFTPGREVPFAGHPTVGTAVFLAGEGAVDLGADGVHPVILEEAVGPVSVDVTVSGGEALSGRLTAAVAPSELPFEVARGEIAAMVGLTEEEIGFDPVAAGLGDFADPELPIVFASAGLEFLMVPVQSLEAAQRSSLDTSVWSRLLPVGSPSRMVYVVAPGGADGVDLHVRMYAPDIGVPEDPATGSACAAMGGWLGARLRPGRSSWSVEQGVEMGRPSRLELQVEVGESGVDTIRVGGDAVRVTRGVMRVP